MSSRGIAIGILIFILVVIIIYTVTMLIMATGQKGLFAPYTPPAPPPDQNAFYPLGVTTNMCQEDITNRNILICASYYGGYSGMTAGEISTSGWTGACDPSTWPKSTTPCAAPVTVTQTASNLDPSTAMFRSAQFLPDG